MIEIASDKPKRNRTVQDSTSLSRHIPLKTLLGAEGIAFLDKLSAV